MLTPSVWLLNSVVFTITVSPRLTGADKEYGLVVLDEHRDVADAQPMAEALVEPGYDAVDR